MVPNLPVLTVSSINCNSLNMSVTSKHNQLKKIYGITKLKTDVIFLSDIRLCNRNLVSASNDCSKIFHTNPYCSYSFFFHSTMAKRGVGILINNALDFSVSDRVKDPEENFLLLKTVIHGRQAVLGSIYGPNDYNPGFFERLSRALRKFSEFPVILGGIGIVRMLPIRSILISIALICKGSLTLDILSCLGKSALNLSSPTHIGCFIPPGRTTPLSQDAMRVKIGLE